MKRLSLLPDSSLRFHVEDAAAAVSAMPLGHKSTVYLQEAHACERELIRRDCIRQTRSTLRRIGSDPLSRRLPRINKRMWPDDSYREVTPRTRCQSDRAELRFHATRLAYLTNSRPE